MECDMFDKYCIYLCGADHEYVYCPDMTWSKEKHLHIFSRTSQNK